MSELGLNFPFSAIVGQERLKLALLVNAANPLIGGLLVRGPKGSGKSMAVRALGDLLPEVEVVADCLFNCSPENVSNMCNSCRSRYDSGENLPLKRKKMKVVTLPLSSTEDRVVGTLDMEKALKEGVKALQLGILAEANQNVLYVDEINLLPDHIVDDLLDAAASGWNAVERESISISHPSRFILVGTMNPEEGELRPQLLDRLPISVTLSTIMDVDKRVEIVKRNLEFKRDPSSFIQKYSSEQGDLKRRILNAKELLGKIKIPDSIIYLASAICANLEVDGQRPDVIMAEAARTIAALSGRVNIVPQDALEAGKLALNHRTRKAGFEGPPAEKEIEGAYEKALGTYRRIEAAPPKEEKSDEDSETPTPGKRYAQPFSGDSRSASTSTESVSEAARGNIEKLKKDGGERKGSGNLPSAKPHDYMFLPLTFLYILFCALSLILFVGLWIFYDGNLTLCFLTYISFLVPCVTFIRWTRKRLIPGKLVMFSGMWKKEESEKSELFKGVPLSGKLKTWMDAKFRILPNMQVKGSRRSFLAGKRGISLTSLTRGRSRFYEKPKKPTGDIALFPTIQAAAINRHVNWHRTPLLSVQLEDVRTKIRVYRAPVTIVLVLDVSGSMTESLSTLAKAVSILNRDAYRKRDRLALIAFKEGAAHILNDPTTNVNVVAGNIRRLRASGGTPLSAGMMKALEVIRNERRRNKDVIPLVVIISDFLPTSPLKKAGHIDPVADTLYVARLLRQNSIPVVVMNTCPSPPTHTYVRWGGSALASEIAKVTGGRHYELPMSSSPWARRTTDAGKVGEIISESIYAETVAKSVMSPIRLQAFQ